MNNFSFDNQAFTIRDYERVKPFASFLPGVAGVDGIPMWTFYVNRGQCITGFGIRDKDAPMMEFSPAAIAYKEVYTRGFRTFVKFEDGQVHEPFGGRSTSQVMDVTMAGLRIQEREQGLRTTVAYCHVPGQPFAGLLRKMTIENVGDRPLVLQVLDGVPEIIPYGVTNDDYKSVGHLLRSWMEVENLQQGIPYFKLRASTADEAEVHAIERGHFCCSWTREGDRLPFVVDMDRVFGEDTSLRMAESFQSQSVDQITSGRMVTANKLPGYFAGTSRQLGVGQTFTLYTLFGHTDDIGGVNEWAGEVYLQVFGERCFQQAEALVNHLTDDIATKTGNPVFDQYCRQTYLDNVLRGGKPILFGQEDPKVFYAYSRKHGDQERDYNFFSISPEHYSQGNGNFRDVNQNRRNDVFFTPQVGTHNMNLFFDLIQLDGYNPLVIDGQYFTLPEQMRASLLKTLQAQTVSRAGYDRLEALLSGVFTPGQVYTAIQQLGTEAQEQDLFGQIMSSARGQYKATHGEGYWSDHWTYNLDLIESYLYVYPDRLADVLLHEPVYRYYDNACYVLPRKTKFEETAGGLRQYVSVRVDEEKAAQLAENPMDTWVRSGYGRGEVVQSTLMAKLVHLVATKVSALDPCGMGVEMEAGKPGWNDAMNGLPGVFGSSMAEQVELLRLVQFMKKALEAVTAQSGDGVAVDLLEEVHGLWRTVTALIRANLQEEVSDFAFWDQSHTALEAYRASIRKGVSGQTAIVTADDLLEELTWVERKLLLGRDKALALGNELLPTFITYRFTALIPRAQWGDQPLEQCLQVEQCVVLPHFLEAPARQLKAVSPDMGKVIHQQVKGSDLYDRALGMYKTSVSLEGQGYDIGRIRAFTPGWLERESVFLHMEYKYLLALLTSGQPEAFFEEAERALVPFLTPDVYGRPTTENVSFIASSVNPDPSQPGRGHFARLSGSTAEFVHMWILMMAGPAPFSVEDGRLRFELAPMLPAWLFDEKGLVQFTLFGHTQVVYQNPDKRATYGQNPVKPSAMHVTFADGRTKETGPVLTGEDAEAIRLGQVTRVVVEME